LNRDVATVSHAAWQHSTTGDLTGRSQRYYVSISFAKDISEQFSEFIEISIQIMVQKFDEVDQGS
jgi:hypothetical protein